MVVPRSVMFWDIRPSSQKKANESKQIAAIISDQPFSYLDLTWKPFLKVRGMCMSMIVLSPGHSFLYGDVFVMSDMPL